MKKTIVIGLILFISVVIGQDFGSIEGKVVDESTGAPLIDANVMLVNTSMGAATDDNGEFNIRLVPAGHYDLRAMYISYETQSITGVIVESGQRIRLDISLGQSKVQGNTVNVTGPTKAGSDVNVLVTQRESDVIESGISAARMRRSGDSNAADALKRVSGVTVVEDKFVYIRGLGDRYSNTQMNSVNIPSPEPDRRAVPLNLFATALIDEINIYKTFIANLPGTFAGGTVNIKTKAYPDQRTLNLGISGGWNDRLNTLPFRGSNGGSTDFLGYDDGTRDIARFIPGDTALKMNYGYWDSSLGQWVENYPGGLTKLEWQDRLGDIGRNIESDYLVPVQKTRMPVSLKINGGDKYFYGPDIEYGFYANAGFANKYSSNLNKYRQFAITQTQQDGQTVTEYNPSQHILRETSKYSTDLGLSFSSGIKYREWLKLDFQQFYTHISEDAVNIGSGNSGNIDDGIFINQDYHEKSLTTSTLNFKANMGYYGSLEVVLSLSKSRLYRPDSRTQVYRKTALRSEDYEDYNGNGLWDFGEPFTDVDGDSQWDEVANADEFRLMTSSQGEDAGKRYFNTGNDRNTTFKLDYTLPMSWFNLKTGVSLEDKKRSFIKREFYHGYIRKGYSGYTTFPTELLLTDRADTGTVFSDENYYFYDSVSGEESGLIIVEDVAALGRNAYDAAEKVDAFYIMADIPVNDAIQVIAGIRSEDYGMDLIPYNPVTGEAYYSGILDTVITANINEQTWLPSLIANYSINDRTKLRLGYSKTLARPQFREIAPYDYQEFYGGEKAVGYPYLKTTRIQNYDLRLEYYPSAGEVISLAFFTKEFTNPIDIAAIIQQENFYKVYQNATQAGIQGIELETHLKLPLLNRYDHFGYMIFNSTYIYSQVETGDMFTLFDGNQLPNNAANLNRPLQGQSDLVANASLNVGIQRRIEGTLTFNYFSKRLISVGGGLLNDEYEYPFQSLNAVVTKTFEHLILSVKGTNLLDSAVRYGLEDAQTGDVHYTRTYRPGLSYSLAFGYTF